MSSKGKLLFRYFSLILLLTAVAESLQGQAPTISRKTANSFLDPWKYPDLADECAIECYWEEVAEVVGRSSSRVKDFMRQLICTMSTTCPNGQYCDVKGSFSHINRLQATCNAHGGWGSWGSWGECSEICELGTKVRIRECNNPIPLGQGSFCRGSKTDETSCRPCDFDKCLSNPCLNGGTCIRIESNFICECTNEYQGATCQDRSPCHGRPCENGAICRYNETTFTCPCTSGYYGNHCEHVDRCMSNPCLNGCTCTPIRSTFICTCQQGVSNI
ncbi:delta-like protein 1 [Pecten maximus]|uniref:delta-like protein 1 n=1 Tax=Pecten maximus TaxID=6579 RepID=UPI001458F900|nr:delta-like protein 1 [Pecten maximus]